MKNAITVKRHMKSLGLSIYRPVDKCLYAVMLDTGAVFETRYLRGTKRDPVSGYRWRRKFEFILKHRYGIPVRYVIDALSKLDKIQGNSGDSTEDGLSCNVLTLCDRGPVKVQVVARAKTILECTPVIFC